VWLGCFSGSGVGWVLVGDGGLGLVLRSGYCIVPCEQIQVLVVCVVQGVVGVGVLREVGVGGGNWRLPEQICQCC
jgi:hypothetical protein